MKTKNIVPICILFLLFGCREDEKGQYPVDNSAPGKVTSAKVEENFAGGSLIVYDIPQDEDALYVRASYELDDGTPMELKSSVYTNNITIVGIGRSREMPVVLTVVDRSRNESEPVTVTAHPLDSPVYAIASSMEVKADFGGIALRWENPEKLPVIIDVFIPGEDNEMLQVDRFYSAAQAGKANVRGQESKETLFSINIKDRWGNAVELMPGSFTPIFEVKLDKSKFRRWNPTGLPYIFDGNAPYQIESLWNDAWHPTIYSAASYVPYMTFDMGQITRISRFKVYQEGREGRLYDLNSPKRFELYGSTTSAVTSDPDTWLFLGYWESHKPSGLPRGEFSDEDLEYAAVQGEDFEIEDCPPVRYIWLRSIETWGQGTRLYIMEMTFWGEPQE